LIALVLMSTATACSGSDKDSSAKTTTTTRPLPQPSAELTLKVGSRTVESAGPEVKLDPATARSVARVANAYIKTGVLDPLVEGKTGDDFESLFGIGIAARIQPGQPDRAALTEEATPRATGKATSLGANLDLTGLADQGGAIVMISGRVGFRITVPTDEGTINIYRVGDLVFEKAGDEWLISGYSMLTRREMDGATTTTSATSAASNDTPTTTSMGDQP
jgi:hypothetical protein